MARYKHIDTSPRFVAVDLEAQLLPGTFEHALNHLLDHEIELSGFDARFNNDDTGANAYPPAMLLKVVLLAYSRGIVSGQGVEPALEIAQRGPFDRQPHPAPRGAADGDVGHRDGCTADEGAGREVRVQHLQHGKTLQPRGLDRGLVALRCEGAA